jgi:tetratricopeptide (TPR) repeat protein
MISKVNKLFVALLIVSISIYLVTRNSAQVSLVITDTLVFHGSLGALVIAAFALGLVTATIVALLFGISSYMRERALKNSLKNKDQLFAKVLEARAATSSHQWQRAHLLWEQLIKRDQKNLLPRLELARTLEKEGALQDALKVLDEARSIHPKNSEVLIRSSELNQKIGNKTAALDTITLAHDFEPNVHTAHIGAELAEELNRFDDALKFATYLQERKHGVLTSEARIRFKQLMAAVNEPTTKEETEALSKEIQTFIKRYPHCLPALLKLADLEEKLGRLDSASRTLVLAAKETQNLDGWNKAIDFWVKNQNPEKALAVARSAREELQGKDRFAAELALIRLLFQYNMLDAAAEALAQFSMIINTRAASLNPSLLTQYFSLQGMYLLRKGDVKSASELWNALYAITNSSDSKSKQAPLVAEAPSPILSTP